MQITLDEKPQKPIIIAGFPTMGLIGTIVTEYLLDHLQTRKIGTVLVEETQPIVAIHQRNIIDPVGIYYNEKHNIVIVHVLSNLQNIEWKFADMLVDLCKQLEAWEIISLEGVLDQSGSEDSQIFYFSNNQQSQEKFTQSEIQPLEEGIVMGVSGALVLKTPENQNFSSLFATTHSQLPDSKAAASVILALDKYMGLAIDPQPLMQRAADFEQKLKTIMETGKATMSEKEKKNLSYVG